VDVLELGMRVRVAIEAIGGVKADSRRPATYQCGNETVEETWLIFRDMGLALAFNEAMRLTRIKVTNRGYVLRKEGLRVGSNAFNVLDYFGPPGGLSDREFKPRMKEMMLQSEWEYAGQGISFSIEDGTVSSITVYERYYDPCSPGVKKR
jgi:hypothetical protein